MITPASTAIEGTHRAPSYIAAEHQRLRFSRFLRIAAHDLHLLRRDRASTIQFEVDIFDQEGPDLIAVAVGIQVALHTRLRQPLLSASCQLRCPFYLEVQARLDLVSQNLSDGSVKAGNHFHSQLRLDATAVHHGIERVDQGKADAIVMAC